ncbi:MAG: transglycosylase SLT domain-containing protein [Desulfobacteraceae bacterium]|nr:transglycosylase SLT domain-containing protein [Desulfobacteraceae bacterium]
MVNFKKAGFMLICLCAAISWAQPGHAYERYNNVKKYDRYFKKYSKRFFGPGFDWLHFKAQAVAESRLIADARSRAGAVGIMQIMPSTFKEIRLKAPAIKGNRKQPRWNIAAGIYYNRQIWKLWKAQRPFQDRLDFTFGAYNAGKTNIIKSQRVAKSKGLNPNLWSSNELPATMFHMEAVSCFTEGGNPPSPHFGRFPPGLD